MKKLWILALAAAVAATACEKEENGPDNGGKKPQVNCTVVDFEEALLATVIYDGFTPATYSNVLEGKALATICDDEDSWFDGSLFYDGILYTEHGLSIGTMFNDGEWMGYGTFDTWSGFAVSSNCNAESSDYANQFSVWKADNGANKFAVGYDSPRGGFGEMAEYDTPTILLDEPKVIYSIDFMNTAYTANTIASFDPNAAYVLKVEGYNGATETGSLNVALAGNGKVVSDWLTVNLTSLGEVDKVRIMVDMSKTASSVSNPMGWMPLYFCIDNIKIVE